MFCALVTIFEPVSSSGGGLPDCRSLATDITLAALLGRLVTFHITAKNNEKSLDYEK
jgi:hypothetical protein